MTPSEFAQITRQVIQREGFDGYEPTACFPARRDIRALAGVPEDIDVRSTVVAWAAGIADAGEEFLVAFKSSPHEFTVIRVEGDSLTEESFKAR